jgi:hypothetical protein
MGMSLDFQGLHMILTLECNTNLEFPVCDDADASSWDDLGPDAVQLDAF